MPYLFPSVRQFANRRLIAATLLWAMVSPSTVAAEQDWWFDVEVIIFKRDNSLNELSEKFVSTALTSSHQQALDLLTPYLQPDLRYLQAGLPFCRASERAKVQTQYEQDFAFPEPVETAQPTEAYVAPDSLNNSAEQDFQYEVVSDSVFDDNTSDTETDGLAEQSNNEPTYSSEPPQTDEQVVQAATDLTPQWIEWQIPQQFPCVYREQLTLLNNPFERDMLQDEGVQNLAAVPVKINGIDKLKKSQAFILPQGELVLGSLFNGINKQRDLQAILHMGWRQEVKFGEDKAQALRLFAGKNFGLEYLPDGHKRSLINPESLMAQAPYVPFGEQQAGSLAVLMQDQLAYQKNAELFQALHLALDSKQSVDLRLPVPHEQAPSHPASDMHTASDLLQPIWQLDGELKVYLQNVGRTPYLHIASNFDFRQPVFEPGLVKENINSDVTVISGQQDRQANYLQSVNFNQFKRVISKQLHYFDHPLFGMLVYITRYQWPDEAESNN